MKKYLLSAVVISGFLFYSTAAKGAPSTSPISTLNLPIQNNNNPASNPPVNGYKNGTFTGPVTDAFYGNIQVAAVIQNGKLANVNILQSPNDRSRSIAINSQALPILQSEAVSAQSAAVDMVSGATDTSAAFIQSLTSALSQAVN
jgi:uncharacterized protein with FMN-binding domain